MNVRGFRFRACWRWSGRVCVSAYCVAMLQGCYVYTAAPAAPPDGTPLRVELNDNGRVGLGGSVGPAALTLEGTTVSNSDSAFLLRISKVGYLSGQSTSWTGESLTIPRSFVIDVREKKFSRRRSWLTTAVVVAAVVTFATTRGLLGFGNDAKEGGNPVPPAQ